MRVQITSLDRQCPWHGFHHPNATEQCTRIVSTLTLTPYPSRDPQVKIQTCEIRRSRWPMTEEEDRMAEHKFRLSLIRLLLSKGTPRVLTL